jgi:hypothetical protein
MIKYQIGYVFNFIQEYSFEPTYDQGNDENNSESWAQFEPYFSPHITAAAEFNLLSWGGANLNFEWNRATDDKTEQYQSSGEENAINTNQKIDGVFKWYRINLGYASPVFLKLRGIIGTSIVSKSFKLSDNSGLSINENEKRNKQYFGFETDPWSSGFLFSILIHPYT